MKTYASLISVGLLSVCCQVFAVHKLYHCTNETSWYQAQGVCSSIDGGKLAEEHILSAYRSTTLLDNLKGRRFWTGEYTVLSPWIAGYGCYRDIFYNVKAQTGNFDISACQRRCRDKPFGIQNGTCICLIGIPDDRFKVDPSFCNLHYNDDYSSLCGGNDGYVNIYKKYVNRNETTQNYHRCVSLNCTAPKYQYKAEDCGNQNQGICHTGNSYVKTDKGSWLEVSSECIKQSSYLLVPYVQNDACKRLPDDHSINPYWVDLHSYETQGSTGSDSQQAYRCYTASIAEDGLHLAPEICYNATVALPFICYSDSSTTPTLPDSCRSLEVNKSEVDIHSNVGNEAFVIPYCLPRDRMDTNTNGATVYMPRSSGGGKSGLTTGIIIASVVIVLLAVVTGALAYRRREWLCMRIRGTRVHSGIDVYSKTERNLSAKKPEVRYNKAADQEYASVSTQNNDLKIKCASEKAEVIENEYYIDAAEDDVVSNDTGSIKGAGSGNDRSKEGNTGHGNVSYVIDENDPGYSKIHHGELKNDVNDMRISTQMLPDDLEGIYDTAVAEIIFNRSMQHVGNPDYDTPKQCRNESQVENFYHEMNERDQETNDDMYIFMSQDE